MPVMSKFVNTAAVLAAAFASQVAAHTYVKEFEAGGKTYPGFYAADKSGGDDSSPAWRTNQGWGFQPVFGDKINDPDIIAHIDAEPSPFTAPVDAGSDVKFTWQHDGECGGDEVGWDCSHHGWTSTWLAPCNGECPEVNKEDLSFFKIHQAGLMDYPTGTRYAEGGDTADTGYWGTDDIFYKNGNSQTVTIPKDLPSGNYVLRTEVMSVHNNGAISERQLWPQALNIKIENGNDNAAVPEGIKATEIYSSSDKQLTFDLYQHEAGETFDAPGPAIPSFGGSGSGSGGASSAAVEAPSSTAAPAVPVESSYAAQPTPEVEDVTPTSEVAQVTATATQIAYVTATATAPAFNPSSAANYNTTTVPEPTPAPETGDEYPEGEQGDEEADDDEDEDDWSEGDYNEGDDDEESYSDDEEESDNEPQAWGGEHRHWRNHAREFIA